MEMPPLTSDDWLDLALEELKSHGYGALKAQPLAKKLNVTRGSFYHHFESLDDFHTAVLAHWSKRSSRQIILDAQQANDPRKALDELLRKTFRSGEDLERAVRSWATVKRSVAKAVEKVDQGRIAVAQELLIKSGTPEAAAVARAKLLYWAAIGRLMLPFPANNLLSEDEISDLTALMLHVQ
jgi:AcrR family transcriptional regulator